jgi:hypothetical protein
VPRRKRALRIARERGQEVDWKRFEGDAMAEELRAALNGKETFFTVEDYFAAAPRLSDGQVAQVLETFLNRGADAFPPSFARQLAETFRPRKGFEDAMQRGLRSSSGSVREAAMASLRALKLKDRSVLHEIFFSGKLKFSSEEVAEAIHDCGLSVKEMADWFENEHGDTDAARALILAMGRRSADDYARFERRLKKELHESDFETFARLLDKSRPRGRSTAGGAGCMSRARRAITSGR